MGGGCLRVAICSLFVYALVSADAHCYQHLASSLLPEYQPCSAHPVRCSWLQACSSFRIHPDLDDCMT